MASNLEDSIKICSAMFQRKKKHKGTWTSSDGKRTNQIYHELIDSRHLNSVPNVQSIRGAEFGTGHNIWF